MTPVQVLKQSLYEAKLYHDDTAGLVEQAIAEIERLNSEAVMKENNFLAEKVVLLSEIKNLHEKVALLQEQKASLNASLDYYER
jgi:predicted  nucleic acid-binding Zn-ribbon protein